MLSFELPYEGTKAFLTKTQFNADKLYVTLTFLLVYHVTAFFDNRDMSDKIYDLERIKLGLLSISLSIFLGLAYDRIMSDERLKKAIGRILRKRDGNEKE